MRRRFVGRAAELAALEAALTAAGEGRPEVVLVGGEAGVGKTRLVGELSERAAASGTLVATGGCVELTAGTAPYLAFTEALRDLGRAVGPRAWERMCAGAPPELAGVLPGASGAPVTRADPAARSRLLGQAHDLLAETASTAPLLLVLEDVHWADRSTLDLAAYLARAVRGERIALVATYRSDETARRPALGAWLAELARAEGVRRLELDPFDEAEIAELLGADPTTGAAIARRSGGNAFLAEELYEAGGDEASLPASIRDLLGVRIAALPPPAQAVLRAAAAAGARVDDELLAAVVDLPAPSSRRRCAPPWRITCSPRMRATAGSRSGTSSCARPRTRSCCRASGAGCTPPARACWRSGRSLVRAPPRRPPPWRATGTPPGTPTERSPRACARPPPRSACTPPPRR